MEKSNKNGDPTVVVFQETWDLFSHDFVSSSEDKWGAVVDLELKICDWKILKILEDSQFHRKGIRIGDKIHAVDNVIANQQNRDLIYDTLKKGNSCHITFLRLKGTREQRRSRKRSSSSMSMEITPCSIPLATKG